MNAIFLYGTLLPSVGIAPLAARVAELPCRGRARVRGRLYNIGPFPGAVVDEAAESEIVGEIFELPDDGELLAALDRFEGSFPDEQGRSLFLRRPVVARLECGAEMEAWIYTYERALDGADLIPHGEYARWLSRRVLSRESP